MTMKAQEKKMHVLYIIIQLQSTDSRGHPPLPLPMGSLGLLTFVRCPKAVHQWFGLCLSTPKM